MKPSILLALAALACVVAPARAQTSPAPQQPADEQEWVRQIQQTVPQGELDAAAAAADVQQNADPLMALAVKYHVEAPDWLKQRVQSQSASVTLASLGDSLTAAMASCSSPYYFCPENSWSTGNLPTSLKQQLARASGRDVHGLLVAVPGVTMAAIPAEAFVVFLANAFGLNIQRMTLLIGDNDPGVCGAPTAGEEASFEKNLGTALRILGHIARGRSAKLFLSSIVEVTTVARYADVTPDGAAKTCFELWTDARRCQPLLKHRNDTAAAARIGAQIARYDDILSRAASGKNWILYTPTFNVSSRLGFPDAAENFSRYDCFHPSAAGQARLGRIAWSGDAGAPGVAAFFALTGSTSH